MSQQIKFSHHYPKLYNQTEAKLILAHVITEEQLNDVLIEYDTTYFPTPTTWEDLYRHYRYKLPKGKLIQLIFLGDKLIPFCTLRRYTESKMNYYQSKIGSSFIIQISSEKEQEKK